MTAAPILITGCSSGIGRSAALRLARAGRLVYATARRPDSIADLEAAGCRLLQLDVTDEPARGPGTSSRLPPVA
jgi:NAD(P)-dependent dehydrogenase (short-subunit alcohol dehydrogenase family)